MDNIINHGKNTLAALALLAFIPVSAVYAEGETDVSSTGNWYLGGSFGNLKSDDARGAGTTRIFGAHLGYQFSDRWSFELGYSSSAGRHDDIFPSTPWGARVRMYDAGFTRYWGDKYRFLVDFGYTHISMDVNAGFDDATAGWHLGAGLSTFVTDNIEVRAVAKEVYSMNEHYEDLIGTVSLNWHFVDASSSSIDNAPVLGESTQESQELPPVTYREEPVVTAPAEEAPPVEVAPEAVAPVEVAPAAEAPAPVTPAETTAAPVPAEVVAPAAAAAVVAAPQATGTTDFVSPTAVPKSTHTLLKFSSSSLDIGAQYGGQLDQLSQEIKNGDSKAVIEGHTDSRGSSESNKVLSLDRAIVVKRELKNRGVSGDKLRAVGMGEEQPVATNDTEEGRAQNRRVEVKIYDNK